jgi:hypothetical protein
MSASFVLKSLNLKALGFHCKITSSLVEELLGETSGALLVTAANISSIGSIYLQKTGSKSLKTLAIYLKVQQVHCKL